MPELNVRLMRGHEAQPLAAEVWQSLPENLQRACLFDIPLRARPARLAQCWELASHVAAITVCDITAYGWLVPTGRDTLTAYCHFIMPKMRETALATGIFTDIAMRFYDCLICIVPAPYRGVCRCIEQAGFEQRAALPKACWLDHRQRAVDGFIYQYRKRQ